RRHGQADQSQLVARSAGARLRPRARARPRAGHQVGAAAGATEGAVDVGEGPHARDPRRGQEGVPLGRLLVDVGEGLAEGALWIHLRSVGDADELQGRAVRASQGRREGQRVRAAMKWRSLALVVSAAGLAAADPPPANPPPTNPPPTNPPPDPPPSLGIPAPASAATRAPFKV